MPTLQHMLYQLHTHTCLSEAEGSSVFAPYSFVLASANLSLQRRNSGHQCLKEKVLEKKFLKFSYFHLLLIGERLTGI